MRPLLSILCLWCACVGLFGTDDTPAPAPPAPAPAPAPVPAPAPAAEPAPEPAAPPAAQPHARIFLGITAKAQDDGQANTRELFPPAVVGTVAPGSNAKRLGILVGDTITVVNGHPVANMNDLIAALRQVKAGDAATVVVTRAGATLTLTGVFQANEVPTDKHASHQDDPIVP